jgi:predicted amidohydrolase
VVRVAAVQAAPVFLDRDATVERACRLIAEAAGEGASLVAFPETWIPGYPAWIFGAAGWDDAAQKRVFGRLNANAVEVPSAAVDELCRAAKEAGTVVAMGMTERDARSSRGTLYNSILYISDRGEVLGVHRKLMPTHAERIVWGQGDGSTRVLGALDAADALRHAREGRADPRRRVARGRRPGAAPLRHAPLRLRGPLLRALRDGCARRA